MSSVRRSLLVAAIAAGIAGSSVGAAEQRPAQTAPETFTSGVQGRTGAGALAATIRIQVDRYSSESDRKLMTDALAHGGYPAFLLALRKAPAVGHVVIEDVKVTLRWAREQPTPKGRAITLVTDAPVYFVGGGRADAKPRAGFELAVLQLAVDDFGMGTGSIAAAARIKPDGAGGVLLEDYAEEPVKLTFVHRVVG